MILNKPFEPARIQALCFDVDGTLSDTDDQFVENLVRIFSPAKFLFPNQDPRPFSRHLVMATETPANLLYGIPDKLGFDGKLNALGNMIYRLGLGTTEKPFRLIPGVPELLRVCEESFPMSIVSARGERSTMRFLRQFNLEGYFHCVATAQTARHTKPFPDPILWAAKEMGVQPQDILMIGDTTVDIHAARRAGAQSVAVLCGFGMEEELRRAGANVILNTTSDLADFFKQVTLLPGN